MVAQRTPIRTRYDHVSLPSPLFQQKKGGGRKGKRGPAGLCPSRAIWRAPMLERGGGQIQVRKVLQRVYLFFHLVLSLAFRLTIILNSCIVWAQTTLYSTTCLRRILGFILGDFVLFSLPTLPVCGTVCSARGIETSPDSNFSIGGTICVRRMWVSAEWVSFVVIFWYRWMSAFEIFLYIMNSLFLRGY